MPYLPGTGGPSRASKVSTPCQGPFWLARADENASKPLARLNERAENNRGSFVSDIACVPFEPAHFDGALRLSQQVGWPHRHDDLQLIIGLSEGIAALYEGRVVGTAFITRFGPSLCACNLIIVDETMRGRGLGRRLMNDIMAMAEPCEIRLVATQAGQPLYAKLGFEATGKVAQYQGVVTGAEDGNGARWIDRPDHDVLMALDENAFGGNRGTLIAALLSAGRVAAIGRTRDVTGFAVLRPFGRGKLIGPVVARNGHDAKALIGFVLAHCEGQFVRIDIPEASGLGSWIAMRGLAPAGGAIAMSSNPEAHRAGAGAHTFALANQAFG